MEGEIESIAIEMLVVGIRMEEIANLNVISMLVVPVVVVTGPMALIIEEAIGEEIDGINDRKDLIEVTAMDGVCEMMAVAVPGRDEAMQMV